MSNIWKLIYVFLVALSGFFLGTQFQKTAWDQTTCHESRVMKYRHSYWYDTQVYCTKTLD
jgi:hypothetical protein